MIKIITKDLLKALRRCKAAVTNKANLNYIKLTFANDYLYLESTNIDLTIKTSISLEKSWGRVVVCYDANKLLSIISLMTAYETINFSFDEKLNTKITTDYNDTITFSLYGINEKIFPKTPIIDGVKPCLILGQIDLKNILESVRISAGVKDARHYLNGVFVSCTKSRVNFVSTDSKRLSMFSEIALNEDLTSFLIPITTVNEVIKLLENNDNDVEIKLKNNRIVFDIPSNNLYIYSSLINADFPDYSQVIPESFSNGIIVDRVEFVNSVNRVSKLCDETLLKIFLTVEGDELTISTRSDLGSASDTIIAACDVEYLVIALNYKLVLDACKCFNGKRLRISLGNDVFPVKFEDIDEDDYFNIIMPMKLEDNNEDE